MRIPLVLAALLVAGATPAFAETSAAPTAVAQLRPRSMNDCEQVKGDLPYNQCLAMFGPAAHTKGGSGDGGASAGPSAAAAAAAAEEPEARPARGRRGRVHARRGGRQSATFSVGRSGGSHGRRGRRHR